MRWRKWTFAALYFTEGAPIGFLWWYLPAHLRERDVAVGNVAALTSLLALVWGLKFLWAPMLDRWRSPRAGYGAWMIGAQVAMAAFLLPLAFLDLAAHLQLVTVLCVAHAVAAATQDVAIDALAIESTPVNERGSVNGWMQAGMLAGRAVFGAAVLALPPRPVVFALCATILLLGFLVWRAGRLRSPEPAPPRHFLRTLVRALWHRHIGLGLLVALTAGLGFEALAGLASTWLVDMGYAPEARTAILGLGAVAAMALGALAGGRLADALGPRRIAALGIVLIAALVPTVVLQPRGPAQVVALIAFYLAIGALTASTYALFMNLTDKRLAATQFTTFMAATNQCESLSVGAAGRLHTRGGYPLAFIVPAVASLVALPLLHGLSRPPEPDAAESTAPDGRATGS